MPLTQKLTGYSCPSCKESFYIDTREKDSFEWLQCPFCGDYRVTQIGDIVMEVSNLRKE